LPPNSWPALARTYLLRLADEVPRADKKGDGQLGL
jgi:hypothetical protein